MTSPSGAPGPTGRQSNSGKNISLGAELPQLNTSNNDDSAMEIDDQTAGIGAAIDPEDEITYSDYEIGDEDEAMATSQAPTEPLMGDSGLLGALDEIRTGAPGSRTDTASRNIRAEIAVKMAAKAEKEKAAKELEAANKKRETFAAQRKAADKSKRPRDATSPTASSKKSMNPWGQPVPKPAGDAMDVEKAAMPQVDFGNMLASIRPLPCAIRVHTSESVIGNPTTLGSTPGLAIKLRLDPGKLAMPSLALDFSISKTGLDSADPNDYNTFSVGWEPGVKIAGKWMMEDLRFRRAVDPSMQTVTYPPEIKKLVHTKEEESRLVCATFKSNAHKSNIYHPAWPLTLAEPAADQVFDNLNTMMDGTGSYAMTIWFMVPGKKEHYDYFAEHVLSHLEYAVEKHLPPNHIYRDEHGEPVINYDMPSIKAVGNGMYARRQKMPGPKGTKVPDNGKLSFVTLPKKHTWDSLKQCRIYYGVSNVREQQFTVGLHAPLQRDWHHVYLERLPVWEVDGAELAPDKPLFKTSFYAGVRMTRDKDGARDAIPPTDAIIKMNLDNGLGNIKAHEVIENEMWYGRVRERSKEWLDATGTDFCVLVTKPRRSRQPQSWNENQVAFQPDSRLPRFKIEVKFDPTAADREAKALEKFCDNDYRPELLDQIRLALVSDPSRAKPAEYADLTWGPKHDKSEENHEKWKAIMDAYSLKRKDNPSQMKVLLSSAKMKSNIVAVAGPPGAGKTRTLRDKCIALLKIKHKVLCVAAANVAVDTDATAVWQGLTKEERKEFKCLRLEGGAAEKAAILSKINYAAYHNKEGEEDELPQYVANATAEDDPSMRNALEKIASDFAARQEQMKGLMDKYDDVDKVYQVLQGQRRLKRSNCPVGMTLDYRIWEMTEDDKASAVKKYDAARKAMGEAEFAKQFAAGTISLDQFDESAVYRARVADYIKKNGKLSRADRLKFEDASDQIITRVLAETCILFTTCSNAGSKLLEDGNSFKPTVIFCDEAGQVGLASLCVPLTTFSDWEGLFLFGDTCQLEPTVLSGQFNEFIHNAKLSPLALLSLKGFSQYLLDTQYRMSPAISMFPNHQFYDRNLKDHPKALLDNENETRGKLRELSKRLGARGFKDQGSEFFLLDVKHGVSRIEVNGTSLVNHANADRIIILITDMIKLDVKPAEIKILSYYQGQRRLLRQKINEANWAQWIKDTIEIHTVDSFQGKESSVVIVDIVAAKDSLKKSARSNPAAQLLQEAEAELEDEMDNGTEAYIKLGTVTGHVRNPNRLNVALTRAMHGLVVVCQEALLVGNPKATKKRGKAYNALSNMCASARVRKCYVLEDQLEDSHPTSIEMRQVWKTKDIKATRKAQTNRDLTFVADLVNVSRELKNYKSNKSIQVPQYRTAEGHTTRPIEATPAVVAAEKHDREQERLAKEAEEMRLAELRSMDSAKEEQDVALALSRSERDAHFPALPPQSKHNDDAMETDDLAQGDKTLEKSANSDQDEDDEPLNSGDEYEGFGGHVATGEEVNPEDDEVLFKD